MKRVLFVTSCMLLLAFAAVFFGCMDTVDLTVKDVEAPVITSQPRGGSVDIGDTRAISLTATGKSLSYQWYSYTTPNQYENHLGNKISNATKASYTPPDFLSEGTFNFYAIVTNTDTGATGRQTISVQSAPASIAVNDPNNAAFPVILKHPENVGNVIFRKNMDLPLLQVEASSADNGEISYQWYVADELTNESGEEIPNATAADFRPIPTEPGEYFYFVKITNENWSVSGRRQSFSLSNPAYVSVIPNPNAETPVISKQPLGAIYFSSDTVSAITVIAEAEDGGVLSYQWQVSPTSATATDFVNVTSGTGGTTESFTPSLNLTSTSRNFYRVVITNYAEFAVNTKTAVITSNAAEVAVATPAVDNANLTITIGDLTSVPANTADSRSTNPKNQFVRGFGVMDVAWANFPNFTMADVENMYNPDKLGYNILRNMILPHNENPVDMLADFTRTDAGAFFYRTVRLVNQYNGYVLSSPWSPPAVWKTNNSTIGSPSSAKLRTMYYRHYANYLRTFAQAMADNGAPIYTISIQNEPNHTATYDGCNWDGTEMMNFFNRVGYFTRAGKTGSDNDVTWPTDIPGYGGGKALTSVRPMSGSSANNPDIHNNALNSNTARANLEIVARHPYGSRNVNIRTTATYRDDPREVWQTEFNLNTTTDTASDSLWPNVWPFMNSVDVHIRNNHENAYIWWAGKRFYSMIGDGESGTTPGQILPRGRGMSHYAKFAKETYHVSVAASGNMYTVAGTSTAVSSGNFNPTSYTNLGGSGNHVGGSDANSRAPKVSAFVKLKDKDYGTSRPMPDPFAVNLTAWDGNVNDIEYISYVMFTPRDGNSGTNDSNSFELRNVKLVTPNGFKIRGAEAMRSVAPPSGIRDVVPTWETVGVSADRGNAFVNLLNNQILSVRLYNE